MGQLDNAGPLSVHTGGTEMLPPKDFRWLGGKRIGVFLRMTFEKGIEIAKKSKDVWIGTRAEGAAHVLKTLKKS